MLGWRTGPEQEELADLHPRPQLIGSVATLESSSVTCPEKPGSIHPAVECVSSPSLPRLDLPSSCPAMSSGSVTTSNVEGECEARWGAARGSSPAVSTSLVRSGCSTAGSMRVTVVLEHPEEAVEPHVHAGRLDQIGRIRIDLDPAGVNLGSDVAVGQHAGNLPVPVTCRVGPRLVRGLPGARDADRRSRGCSSMVERQLPKLIVRVRFPSPGSTP